MTDGKRTRRAQAKKIYKWFKGEVDPGFRSPCPEFDDSVLERIEAELLAAEQRGLRLAKKEA